MTPIARGAVLFAIAAWAAVLGAWWSLPAVLGLCSWWRLGRTGAAVVLASFTLGVAVNAAHARVPDPLPAGRIVLDGTVRLDLDARWGWTGLVSTDRGMVLVDAETEPAGHAVRVDGSADGQARRVAGRWVVSSVDADDIREIPPAGLHARIADGLRRRIGEGIEPWQDEARGLLLGFLVGDVSAVGPVTRDDMRAAGLSHLVAVSGSNVALFLVGLVAVTAPIAVFPRARLLVVLNGLIVFGMLTRWEPSVVRASAMAGLVSAGRLAGLPLEPVTALALVAGGGVLLAPLLASSLGFQLSVLACGGMLFAVRTGFRRRPLASMAVATVAAQLAVAPLLVATVGSVPVLAPLANLVAIPLVTVATSAAGVGALVGADWLVSLGAGAARLVIGVARLAAPWPQVGWAGLAVITCVGVLWVAVPRARGAAFLAAVACVGVLVLPVRAAPESGVVFLDVGQGDAALVRLDGVTILVDGGPDPVVLLDRLRAHGIGSVDLMVATHVHADHVTGLTGVIGRIPVGGLWEAFGPHRTPASDALLDAAAAHDVPVDTAPVGHTLSVGSGRVDVLGPRRRYAGPNDQSVVLRVEIDGAVFLLPGDIETVAQSEIAVGDVDVLKVPHQGAATSDEAWLRAHAGRIAVVSVGPNDFGHPADWVMEALEGAGADVMRTDRHGDVVVEVEAGKARVSTSGQG